MRYALRVVEFGEKAHYVCSEHNTKFYGTDEKRIFQNCLELYLQEQEGSVGCPDKKNPWIFVKSESEQDILNGLGEVIKILHNEDKDSLWELYDWASGSCTMFRIVVDY